MKNILCPLFGLILAHSPLIGLSPFTDLTSLNKDEGKIAINNIPLAKINGNVISLNDVIKEMDFKMYSNDPASFKNNYLRYSYYNEGWKRELKELVHLEFLKKEAEERKYSVSDAEARQEMMSRFGTEFMKNIAQANLTYENVKNSVKNDILVQHMNWWGFVDKIVYKIGPQKLKTAYDAYLFENPGSQTWKYQFLTIRVASKEKADEIGFKVKALDPKTFPNLTAFKEAILSLMPANEDFKLSITDELTVEDRSIALAHKNILTSLQVDTISEPNFSQIKNDYVIRVFHLVDSIKTEPETFQQISERLKGQLINKVYEQEKDQYFDRLKEKYGYTDAIIYLPVPENFEPFVYKEEI